MKAEAFTFGILAVFVAIVAPIYWLLSHDPTGTSALVMTFGLTALVAFYLGFHAKKMDLRPEDDRDAEIVDGTGELGFFPPYSWWPLWSALALATCVVGVVFGWWLFIIGAGAGSIALVGWVFEYYRGEHAH